jgi:UDPglucose--hexose-1-phosphate uridylyltransferase
VFAGGRADRPFQFAAPEIVDHAAVPSHLASCPFCPGNEAETPHELARYDSDGNNTVNSSSSNNNNNNKDWKLRVVPNKFPVLRAPQHNECLDSLTASSTRDTRPLRTAETATGYHEVLIESPRHNHRIAAASSAQVQLLFRAFLERGRAMARDKHIKHIIFFKNNGPKSGASLQHPHAQVVGLPIIPSDYRARQYVARSHYAKHGSCVMCDTVKNELAYARRIVAQNDRFVAFVPFAALSPFQCYIMPKVHRACFLDTPPEDMLQLASIVKNTLERLDAVLDKPDFNIVLRSAPVRDPKDNEHVQHNTKDFYHYYIDLFPRLGSGGMAGFEVIT